MNTAARMVISCRKYTSISHEFSAINVLHWLPVNQRLQFKIAFLASNCIRGAAVQHISSRSPCGRRISLVQTVSVLRNVHGYLVVPRTATELGKRSFSMAAPVIWNSCARPPSSKDSFSVD